MAQAAVNEAVDQLLGEIAEAWNAGDARAYAARYRPDGTFTNTNGTIDMGRDEVVRTAEEAFQGVLAGTKGIAGGTEAPPDPPGCRRCRP